MLVVPIILHGCSYDQRFCHGLASLSDMHTAFPKQELYVRISNSDLVVVYADTISVQPCVVMKMLDVSPICRSVRYCEPLRTQT